MKILAFNDTHGSRKAIRSVSKKAREHNPDILVCAGDISIFGNELRYMLGKINKINKPTLIIHGNHETASELGHLCLKYKNITFIHKKIKKINSFTFLGYGGGGFSLRDRGFEKFAKRIRKNSLILVAHAPPYGTKVDKILDEHCGNKSIRDFIYKKQPLLCLCGHLHETEGRKDKIKKTVVMNAGPFGKIVNIDYKKKNIK